jgi:hypothetical protein
MAFIVLLPFKQRKNGKKYRISATARDKFNIKWQDLFFEITPAFLFVIRYLNFYADKDERPIPKKSTLSNDEILKTELDMFIKWLKELSGGNSTISIYLGKIITISMRLNLMIMHKKICMLSNAYYVVITMDNK